ncbi:hypothetical protein BV25DRAFT_1791567 [Artomyces pyxidatus]|uniref:Uncharacterized protein n=1 Tax=Artomyces pyxidatus TaxID=48021 RepID=A0ACB8TJK0_9AGAM|nr:hypothetical protein BV25DRAFT_1791567 [Artomyces pyxidatus]
MSSGPIIDWSRFDWKPAPDDPILLRREVAAGEAIADIWQRFDHGEQTLFFGAVTTFHVPVPAHTVLSCARRAWTAVRFAVPLVAAHTEYDATGSAFITYRPESDAQAIEAWAARTVRLAEGAQDLDELRSELSRVVLPEAGGDQTMIYVLRYSDTRYGFLLHTSHVPFDSAGVKLVMKGLLQNIARGLGGAAEESFRWGAEATNLLPAAHAIGGVCEDAAYHQTVRSILNDFGTIFQKQRGFRLREHASGQGPTRRLSFVFSEEESTVFFRTCKQVGLTVNQLLHAAVTLITYLDNPPPEPASDELYVYFGLVDARRHLSQEHKFYPGYCLGMSPICVPSKVVGEALPRGEKEALYAAAAAVKAEYARQAAYGGFVLAHAAVIDATFMEMGAKQGNLPPPATGPGYSGDGIGESYLDRIYNDAAGVPRIRIDDIFVSLNKTDPGPFFRTYTWNKRLNLSVDFNEHAMTRDVVQGFLDKWVELTRLIFT